ncbi:plasmid replication protein, partial [Lactobacillus sp. XV13L]|nr:plasmid replication protein [Lactobacillus sp. XV13L]
SKSSMAKGRGTVFTSLEGLVDRAEKLTHWTPNVFNYLTYADPERRIIKGHEEQNLSQINTFVVDLDFASKGQAELEKTNLMLNLIVADRFVPTLVLQTTKGYQAYYILDQPAYVRRNKTGKLPVVQAASAIANNLKQALQKKLPQLDVGCNNFGVFRIPRADNIIFFEPEMTHKFKELMEWSKLVSNQQEDDIPLHLVHAFKQTDQGWFSQLLHLDNLRPGRGLARHSALLTIALAAYASKINKEDALNILDEFNTRLKYPTNNREVYQCLKDAYSGKYRGASKVYVDQLLANWVNDKNRIQGHTKSNRKGWYKFKKKRGERVYSHVEEWEEDLLKYINNHKKIDNTGFVQISMRIIRKDLGISLSSLNRVLKRLKAEGLILYKRGQGRSAAKFATYKTIIYALGLNKAEFKKTLRTNLQQLKEYSRQNLKNATQLLKIQQEKWPNTG